MANGKIRPCSYAFTTRLVHGEPHLTSGSKVWVRQISRNRRACVVYDRGLEDASEVQCLYWVDLDALSYEAPISR